VATTLVVSIVTMPFIAAHFGRLQVYGVFANLVAMPLTSFWIMPLGMASLAFMPFGLESVFLRLASGGLTLLLYVAAAVADCPGAIVLWPTWPLWGLVVASAGLLWLGLMRGAWRWAGAVLAVCACGGAAWTAQAQRPVLLLDGEGRGVYARLDDSVWSIGPKAPESFVKTAWHRALGLDEQAKADILPEGDAVEGLVCDDWACRLQTPGGARLSLVKDGQALREECAWAGVVVIMPRGLVPRDRACRQKSLFAYDVRRGDGAWLWPDTDTPTGWRVRYVAEANPRIWDQ